MDISKPLTDVSAYDFTRAQDPMSARYDKKHNRPKDYVKITELDALE